jgi:glycosyltransferase involved in cell wall biosynthesis
MRIVLIGNYRPDKQESMIRFAHMLQSGFIREGFTAEIWWPNIYFGKGHQITNAGFGKWLGYIDKWLIFPLILRRRLKTKAYNKKDIHFHICDHSNAPYLKSLPNTTSITCHDVLAIRGAMGHKETHASASRFGKILQKWILRYLSTATSVACVSQFTLNQLQELIKEQKTEQQNWCVIHNAFNADFRRIEKDEIEFLLPKIGLNTKTPFILHVGSGHVRKNRKLLIDMVAALGKEWTGNICFAGEAIEPDLMTHAEVLQLTNRIISVVSPNHNELIALYSSCEAFIFPSFSEGFGWPLIEAQACGAPVIASSIQPMPEVSGGGALHVDPTDAKAFAEAFVSLKNKDIKAQMIDKGYKNCTRFSLKGIIESYIQFFNSTKI